MFNKNMTNINYILNNIAIIFSLLYNLPFILLLEFLQINGFYLCKKEGFKKETYNPIILPFGMTKKLIIYISLVSSFVYLGIWLYLNNAIK